jgi:hypothetical protein
MTPEQREARRQRSLLEGTGWDVGNGVLYVASDDARWVTDVVLPIDAGATAGAGRLPIPTLRVGNIGLPGLEDANDPA